jgi:hypothetical protein
MKVRKAIKQLKVRKTIQYHKQTDIAVYPVFTLCCILMIFQVITFPRALMNMINIAIFQQASSGKNHKLTGDYKQRYICGLPKYTHALQKPVNLRHID